MRKYIKIIFGVILMTAIMSGCGTEEVSEPETEIAEEVNLVVDVPDKESQSKEVLSPAIPEENVPVDDDIEVAVVKKVTPVVETEPQQPEKPVVETEPQRPEKPVVAQTVSEEAGSFFAVYSEAEMNEALNNGDLPTYFQMLNANSAATLLPSADIPTEVPVVETEMQCHLSEKFVQYLNIKRESEGLSSLSWNSSMAETALARVEEITVDFSHNGVRNCAAENLAMLGSGSPSDWYDSFYASEVHKQNMLDGTYHSAAAAVCQAGGTYYVAVLFGF